MEVERTVLDESGVSAAVPDLVSRDRILRLKASLLFRIVRGREKPGESVGTRGRWDKCWGGLVGVGREEGGEEE
jgi:hypothetical protein